MGCWYLVVELCRGENTDSARWISGVIFILPAAGSRQAGLWLPAGLGGLLSGVPWVSSDTLLLYIIAVPPPTHPWDEDPGV